LPQALRSPGERSVDGHLPKPDKKMTIDLMPPVAFAPFAITALPAVRAVHERHSRVEGMVTPAAVLEYF